MSDDRPAPLERPDRAGWFEDPDHPEQLRYFDGILWSSHTTPRRTRWTAAETAAAASAAGAATAAPVAPPASSTSGPYGYPQTPTPVRPGEGAPGPQAPVQANPYAAPGLQVGYPSGPTTADGVPLATIASRFGAWLLDSIATWLVGLIVGAPLLWLGLGNYPDLVAEALRTGSADAAALAEQIQFDMRWLGAFAVLQLVIGVGYHTFFLSRKGATPGKQVAGISVRLADRPGVLSGTDAMRRSVLRPVLTLFSYTPVLSLVALPLSIVDLASALWEPQRRTLHDRIARTVVVRGPQPPRVPGASDR